MNLSLLLLVAHSYLNSHYIYASNGSHYENGVYYQSFDCSSYVLRCLQEVEFIKDKKDRSAQMLYKYLMGREDRVFMGGISKDSILFFGESIKKITHVAIAIDNYHMIGCSSGDNTTINIIEAVKRNAKVKIQRINYRNDLVASIKLEL